MPSWPALLPQLPLSEGYEETAGPNTIRSQVDSGPMKMRRRFTTSQDRHVMIFEVDSTQLTIFKDFYRTALSYGSLAFDLTHPHEQVPASFAFSEEPSWHNVGGPIWQIRCALIRQDKPASLVTPPAEMQGRARMFPRVFGFATSPGIQALAGYIRNAALLAGNITAAVAQVGGMARTVHRMLAAPMYIQTSVAPVRVIVRVKPAAFGAGSLAQLSGAIRQTARLTGTSIQMVNKATPVKVIVRVNCATLTLL